MTDGDNDDGDDDDEEEEEEEVEDVDLRSFSTKDMFVSRLNIRSNDDDKVVVDLSPPP